MMKLASPKPFTFEGGDRAVLLLHGFTGNSADVRMLGRFLEKKGYTCHAPIYKGHGVPPEELVHTGPEDWWKDVMNAYQHLKDQGYEKIAAVGLSLGGVFSLKLAYTLPILGVVPMCAPMYIKSEEIMYQGILAYAREYKKREQKSPERIEQEMFEFKQTPMNTLKALQELIRDVRNNVDMIYAPTFVVQARHDEMINTDSANIIYNGVESTLKDIKWYEDSTHVITLDKERDVLHEDVYNFLEQLDW
ncbi:alpha/beta fold hydrolase [Bacillus mycoides]|jgi:carboxylesterase|uniref:Carboxylesterase n=10 Tax=Bacillus cereus group TaxID=86661 RepID=A0A1S9TMG6_BACCE|nr:carboxylesterase [Bacillus mycoides KBAB4]AIW87256.1 carboxylesterase [Bacillus mycoides]EEL03616.1 Carboxylesterase [Bacillus cereus BDRD-ST196]EEL96771.1 Carboxylesterase [Bacillus mycoides DSM 2048]EJQ65318.1 carboxylesterase [Bacillus cereus HuA2-4]EJQ87297.1 carboxylesterase [Bacillus cereus HuA4-10]EJR28201.1 carboxylesterase [Bacillus cereus VD048]EJS00556.1 carboxylesterase [Bacillus cereus VDM034]EJS16537.1 carboxylesterase [Bacillus cereus VDM062]EJV77543.1 carboxylesterase [B